MCKKKGGKAKCHINLLIGGDVNCNFIFHSKQFLLVSKHFPGANQNFPRPQHVVSEYSSHFLCFFVSPAKCCWSSAWKDVLFGQVCLLFDFSISFRKVLHTIIWHPGGEVAEVLFWKVCVYKTRIYIYLGQRLEAVAPHLITTLR